MSQYTATVSWLRGEAKFTDNRYSRAHTWRFDGGIEVPASSSPQVVPVPLSVAAAVDPDAHRCHLLGRDRMLGLEPACGLDGGVGQVAGRVVLEEVGAQVEAERRG